MLQGSIKQCQRAAACFDYHIGEGYAAVIGRSFVGVMGLSMIGAIFIFSPLLACGFTMLVSIVVVGYVIRHQANHREKEARLQTDNAAKEAKRILLDYESKWETMREKRKSAVPVMLGYMGVREFIDSLVPNAPSGAPLIGPWQQEENIIEIMRFF